MGIKIALLYATNISLFLCFISYKIQKYFAALIRSISTAVFENLGLSRGVLLQFLAHYLQNIFGLFLPRSDFSQMAKEFWGQMRREL